ncbi:MAG: YicC/YloC family endoribonuclease [Planctomycetota bacterium]
MTGYGSASGAVEDVEYSVEVRTVNNRYFKCSSRLPEVWAGAEADMERRIRGRVSRGSITLRVGMRVSQEQAAYRVNTEVLTHYLDQLRVMEIEADPNLRIDLATVLQLPGVTEPPPLEEVVEQTRDGLMNLLDQALDGLVEMRVTEGQALEADFRKHLDVIRERLDRVASRAPDVVQEYHQRLTERVNELTRQARINIDQENLAREVAIFAERSDIAEEVSRLGGHLEQFQETLASDEPVPVGRKLDFISQEMLREANTIASKSSDVEIARLIVEIKSSIDRIKEQVQNVE